MDRPIGNVVTPYHTPTHVAHLTIALFKATFSNIGPEGYPFRYSSDFANSKIAIDTVHNKDARIIGKKPTVAITRGSINAGNLVLGDNAASAFPREQYLKTNVVSSSVNFRISSNTFAECEALGNEVYNFIIACRGVFPKMFGVLHVDSLQLTETTQSEKDDLIYVAHAMFNYSMQYKWYYIEWERIFKSLHIFLQDEEVYSVEFD